jgi:hypothetical protein
MVFSDLDHVHFVIAFEVDLAEIVFIEEVVDDNEPFVVVGSIPPAIPRLGTARGTSLIRNVSQFRGGWDN